MEFGLSDTNTSDARPLNVSSATGRRRSSTQTALLHSVKDDRAVVREIPDTGASIIRSRNSSSPSPLRVHPPPASMCVHEIYELLQLCMK